MNDSGTPVTNPMQSLPWETESSSVTVVHSAGFALVVSGYNAFRSLKEENASAIIFSDASMSKFPAIIISMGAFSIISE